MTPTLIDPADDRPDTRGISGCAVVMTEPEALIIRRFPIGLPVEAAIRDNSDTVYGTVVGHRLCPECSVYVIMEGGHPIRSTTGSSVRSTGMNGCTCRAALRGSSGSSPASGTP